MFATALAQDTMEGIVKNVSSVHFVLCSMIVGAQ